MPNRIIKESICTSENIEQLSAFQETVFYRLLVNCDDYGCFDARVKVVASRLFPLKVIRPSEIIKALNKLAEAGLIVLYEAKGKPYLKVVKWSDHQRVRVSKHKYPMPEDGVLCGELPQVAASCGEMRPESNPIQSNPNPNPNPNPTREPRGESDSDHEARFDRFWDAYPRKESKPAARKAFDKIRPDGELLSRMIESIRRWEKSAQWQENGGQFIPYPASWLNQRKWEDDPPAGKKKVLPAQDFKQRDYSNVEADAMASLEAEIAAMREAEGL
jgi:hypothetical protein